MKTSNCCDAYVNPDLMICSDCKEHCGVVEEETLEWIDDFKIFIDDLREKDSDLRYGLMPWNINKIAQFIAETIQKERDRLITEIYAIDYKKEHICRFNDGKHDCDCYLTGRLDAIKLIQNHDKKGL